MAHWYEDRLTRRAEALPGIFAVQLGLADDPTKKKRRKRRPHRRRR
jgi:hypothetical protein